jgi:hypothetical protein
MTLAASFQPVARSEYLDRLEALPPSADFTPRFWATVHDEVQAQLESLEAGVRQRLPAVRVSAGRTSGENFLLFSYRTFFMPEMPVDPVVVGMTFTSADQGVTVDADISGEQTGDCISALPSKMVPNSKDELLAAVHELARSLCQSAHAIASAVTDPSRGVE